MATRSVPGTSSPACCLMEVWNGLSRFRPGAVPPSRNTPCLIPHGPFCLPLCLFLFPSDLSCPFSHPLVMLGPSFPLGLGKARKPFKIQGRQGKNLGIWQLVVEPQALQPPTQLVCWALSEPSSGSCPQHPLSEPPPPNFMQAPGLALQSLKLLWLMS